MYICISYLNQITPQKQQATNEQVQSDLDRLVSDACETSSPHTTRSRRSVRRPHLFGSREPNEPVPKKTRTVNGDKCPITGCELYIKHAKNLKRHLRQKHGQLLKDGTYGLIKYKCKHDGCSIECMNLTNILGHLKDQHSKSANKYEQIVYEIDRNIQIELEPYFVK